MKRLLASALCAAIILLSPGLPAYQALAADVGGKGKADAAPVVVPQVGAPLSVPGATNLGANLAVPALSGAAVPQALPSAGHVGSAANPVASNLPAANEPMVAAAALPGAHAAAPRASLAPAGHGPSAGGPLSASGPSNKGSVSGSAASGSETGASGAAQGEESREQLSRDLSDAKQDKGRVLSWVFDRLGRKGVVNSLDEVSAGAPTRRSEAELGKATGEKGPAKKPLIERAAAKLGFQDFNATEKAYILGQSAFMFGAAIYITSMPLLVKALAGSAADTGIVRMTHYWTLGLASLFAGEIVKRVPMKKVLVRAGIGRAAIYGSIGALALMGALHWGLFVGLVGANALLVAHNHLVDMDAAGANKIFSTTEKKKQAFRLYKTLRYSMLLVMPWVLGLGMDRLDSVFGPGTGPKAGFLAFGAMMGLTAWIYQTRLKMAALDVVDKAGEVAQKLSPRQLASSIGRFFKDTPRRNWETFKIIAGNKAVLIRTIMSTVEQFLEDALFFVVLPTFAVETLGLAGFGNGLVLSSMYLGGLITSMFLVKKAPKLEKKMGAYKFVALLSVAAAAAVIPSVALWAVPSIWVVLPVVALMKFLLDPIQTQMQSLLQEAIDQDPKTKPHEENIFGLMTVFETLAAGAGGLAFTWIFKNAGTTGVLTQALGANAPMKIVTGMLAVFSIVYLASLPLLKKQLSRRVPRSPPADAAREAAALQKLETNLKKLGLPPHKTAVDESQPDQSRPTVAILAPASLYKLSIAREGGRQSPGDVNLVLDPAWLIQDVGHDGKNRLRVTKGLVFDKDGQATIVEYKTPREVRYFANFYTMGANGRDDGNPLEENLDVPQSNSLRLEKTTNDKLLTRLMLSAKGVAVPATLALLMAAHPLRGQAAGGELATVKDMPATREQVKAEVEAFLAKFPGQELVVKPSGPNFHSGIGVGFFHRDQVDAIVDHALALKSNELMSDDGVVLVEERIIPPALYFTTEKWDGKGDFGILEGNRVRINALSAAEIPHAQAWEKKDYNFRVLAARTPDDGGVTTGIFSRAGAWGKPTNAEAPDPRDSAAVITVDEVIRNLRLQHGLLKTDAEAAQFKADLEKLGADAVVALAQQENEGRVRKDGEAWQDQTDFIGLDVMLQQRGGKLVPTIIEVNDHDSGGQAQLDEFEPQQAGAHSREWVATMLARARRDALKGKRIVLVGAGYPNKRAFLEKAKALGVEVVLVDKGLTGFAKLKDWLSVKLLGRPSKDNWAKDLVSEFVNEDLSTASKEAIASAAKKIQRSIRKNGKIDGITSYWEDDVLETAKLAEALGLPYHPVEAVEIARSKYRTIEELNHHGVHKRATYKIDSRAQLEQLLKEGLVPPKWFLKPENGAEAQFSASYKQGDILKVYDEMHAKIEASDDPVFKASRAFNLTNFLDGNEWDYNVVLQDGKFVDGRLTDNWPTNPGSSKATGSSIPARAVSEAEKQAAHDLTVNSLLALGFRDGVFHVEGIGEDLLEINVRPGGSYTRAWNEDVYGVDEAEMLFLTAARVPITGMVSQKPTKVLEGAFVFAAERGVIKEIGLTAEAKKIPGLHLIIEKKPGKTITDDENRVAMIYAEGKTAQEALAKLGADPRNDARKLLHLVVE